MDDDLRGKKVTAVLSTTGRRGGVSGRQGGRGEGDPTAQATDEAAIPLRASATLRKEAEKRNEATKTNVLQPMPCLTPSGLGIDGIQAESREHG
jgi:hypothetical protein